MTEIYLYIYLSCRVVVSTHLRHVKLELSVNVRGLQVGHDKHAGARAYAVAVCGERLPGEDVNT